MTADSHTESYMMTLHAVALRRSTKGARRSPRQTLCT